MTRPRQADVTTFRFVQSLCRILAVASCAVALAQAGCGLHPATESRSIPRRRYRPLGGACDRSLGGRRHRRGATLQLRTPRRGDDMVSSQRWRRPLPALLASRSVSLWVAVASAPSSQRGTIHRGSARTPPVSRNPGRDHRRRTDLKRPVTRAGRRRRRREASGLRRAAGP